MADENKHRRAVDMSDDKMKEALKEWLDEKATQFGWLSIKFIGMVISGGVARFWIDGALVGTIASGLPSGPTERMSICALTSAQIQAITL